EGRRAAGRSPARLDFNDPALVDDDGPGTEDAVRQHHFGARQDDHSSSLLQSVWTCSLRPVSGKGARASSLSPNSSRSIRVTRAIICRSSGAWITSTPPLSSGGKRRSSR